MPKTQTITVKARGLYDTGNNPWTLPDGALSEATNIEIGRDNVITPRRGMDKVPVTLSGTSAALHHLFRYLGSWVSAATSGAPGGIYITSDLGATWTSLGGSGLVGSGNYGQSAEALKSLFYTHTDGTQVLETTASTPRTAGVVPALDIKYSGLTGAPGTAVADATQVAYRYVFGRKEANGRILLGVPSSRIVVSNSTGGVKNAEIILTIPAAVADGTHFVQLYRTSGSVDVNTDPGDECYLVWEAAVAAGGAITSVTVTDTTPDGLGGASLYTNPSQETILGGNEMPPTAGDLAMFGGSMWYARVKFPARATINLLGVSGTNGLALNDTITVNSQVFTAKAAENIAGLEFQLFTAGTPDKNMRDTANSLVRCINRTSAAGSYAQDISEPAPAGIPGTISIQRTDRGSTLTIAVSRSTAWSPAAGVTVAPVYNASGLVYSKTDQPDAITTALAVSPILVGAANEPIWRIVATRNSLWVLKQDGLWRITGSAGQFDVQSFDPTSRIARSRTAAALDNKCYFVSDSGIVRASETGVELISRPIENLLYFYGSNESTLSVAVAREVRHQYIVWDDLGAGWTFDVQTETWTSRPAGEYTVTSYPAVDDNTGRLLVLPPGASSVVGSMFRERGATDSVIYADASQAVTLSAGATDIGGGSYTVPLTTSPTVTAGDLLVQGSAKATISGTLATPSRLVLRDVSGTFTAAAATVYASFQMTATYAVKSSTPGTTAEWQEAALLFGNVDGDTAAVTLTGDSGSDAAITIDKTANPGEARQIRVWPGRTSSYSGIMKLSYSERVGYATRATEIAGVAWTLTPQGNGVSR